MNKPLTHKDIRAMANIHDLPRRRLRALSSPPHKPPPLPPEVPIRSIPLVYQPNVVYSKNVGYFFKSKLLNLPAEVQKGQVLGVIKMLGLACPVYAPCSGWIDEITLTCGTPVEYGQPLIVIRI
jgi:biotin carboxyl carrier protein